VLGWTCALSGPIIAIVTIIQAVNNVYWEHEHTFQILVGVGVVFLGMVLVSIGEFIGVFLAIEMNTRRTAELPPGTDDANTSIIGSSASNSLSVTPPLSPQGNEKDFDELWEPSQGLPR